MMEDTEMSGGKVDAEAFADDESQLMEPMEVRSSSTTSKRRFFSLKADVEDIAPFQKMYISPRTFAFSINSLRLAISVDAVAGTIEQPNYPIMVLAGAHPDSFPDTGGLGFSAATYFVPMSALTGVAIASMVIGSLSDRIGRKPCLLLCLYGTVIGSILKYFFRYAFWPYCAFNFLNGLVSASVPIALAYAGDVYPEKGEKEREIGVLVGLSMLGTAGGGIIAILMESQGLFAPLLVGAAMVGIAAVVCTRYIIEPRDIVASRKKNDEEEDYEEEDEGNEVSVPKKLDTKNMLIIIMGSLADNIGSSGLMPLCLSPLAFNAFYTDLLPDPIMSQVAYKWISVLVALMVVPGTLLSPSVFNKLGLAGGCILGNVITGIVTIALLYIALIRPATSLSFGFFVALLYLCFPFTVISQLSTGPMLEAISPPDKRGFSQGVNITVMNFGAAISPFLLGLLSDTAGTPVAIWTCVAVSFLAAALNIPLLLVKGLGRPPKPLPAESKPLRGEDTELVQRALRGEWIPAKDLEQLNARRFQNGQPYLVVHPKKYDDEKDHLHKLRTNAKQDYIFQRKKMKEYILAINAHDDLASLCKQINHSIDSADAEDVEKVNKELGEWFASYLSDAGYVIHSDQQLIKQMIMSAFPVVNPDKTLTPENLERVLLDTERIYGQLIRLEEGEGRGYDVRSVLANARGAMLQQTI